MKILVIQQKMIGDVLTSSILFEALRAKYPDATLHYLINSHTLPVVQNNPFIDEFVFFTPEIENSKLQLFKFLKTIRAQQYHIIIDAYSKLSSNLITLFSGAKHKISKHKTYTAFLYTHTCKYKQTAQSTAGLAIENRLQLLESLHIDKTNLKPKIYLTPKEITSAKDSLVAKGVNLDQPLFMISVLGSSLNKTYPFNYMAQVIDAIVEQTQGQILFNYIPKQEAQAKTILNLCKPATKDHVLFNIFGKSLREFLAITHHCDALIGNEGGAVNMAKALNIPTFTIFSPWIDKATWSLFENGTTNVSIHLKDVKPQLYKATKPLKTLKSKAQELYLEFKPETITPEIVKFLDQF